MNKKEIWGKSKHVWKTATEALKELPKTIDKSDLVNCVKVIADCKGRIITTGVGTSAMAAKKIAHSLSCIERPSFFLSPADAAHGALGSIQSGDIAILISKGGNTSEIINLIPSLKTKKIYIIGVTENNDSTLAKNSDIFLKVKVNREADEFNMLATTSITAVIAVFDAICISLMSYTGYTKKKFSIIHPGGAVGKRLLKETDKSGLKND
ncbi:MAG: SIS domain-containing protein [Candidatus Atribacteria bacterium]|nr:MAG: SIS domain-containing protein [Candidatus Atribacteria bacterium]